MLSANVIDLAAFRSAKQIEKPVRSIYDVIHESTTHEHYQEELLEFLEIPGNYENQLDVIAKIREDSWAVAIEANMKFQLGQWTLDRIYDKHVDIIMMMLGFDATREKSF